jgi:hypothetical protein
MHQERQCDGEIWPPHGVTNGEDRDKENLAWAEDENAKSGGMATGLGRAPEQEK